MDIPPTQDEISPHGNYLTIPLSTIGNDDLGFYGEPPKGDVQLAGIPFYISVAFGTQGDLLRDRPDSQTLRLDSPIGHPTNMYFLINSGATYTQFRNLELGKIILTFNDGSSFDTSLIIGKNIREWRLGVPGVVNTVTSSDSQEVFRLSKAGQDFAILDMLTVKVPENQTNGSGLSSITFTDLSLQNMGSYDPGYFIAGVTVELAH